MVIPAWHLAVLFFLYAAEYLWRFFTRRENRYISLGKAIGRLTMTGVYMYLSIFDNTPAQAQVLVRYSLLLFVLVDLTFVAQEHLMRRYIK